MTTVPLLDLSPHPAVATTQPGPVRAAAHLAADGGLTLDYRIDAPAGSLLLPPPADPVFTDELWQHTCCEAFVAATGSHAYREFNFSPSGAWAVYDFSGYRQRIATPIPAAGPRIAYQADAWGLALRATLPAALLPAADTWRIGLTVVLESVGGQKSWWALAHTADRPDFHPLASFTLTLNRNAS